MSRSIVIKVPSTQIKHEDENVIPEQSDYDKTQTSATNVYSLEEEEIIEEDNNEYEDEEQEDEANETDEDEEDKDKMECVYLSETPVPKPKTRSASKKKHKTAPKSARSRPATANPQQLRLNIASPSPPPSFNKSPQPMNFFLLTPKLGERGLLEWRRRGLRSARELSLSDGLWVSGAKMKPRDTGSRSSATTRDRPTQLTTRRPKSSQPQPPQQRPPGLENAPYNTVCITTFIKHFPSDSIVLPTPRVHDERECLRTGRPFLQMNSTQRTPRERSQSGNNNSHHNGATKSMPIPIRSAKTPRESVNGSARPRFSPYVSKSLNRPTTSSRRRLVTVSGEQDIKDPRIYPTENNHKAAPSPREIMSMSYDGTFFNNRNNSATRREFVIHPEWVSESVSIEKLHIRDRPLIQPVPRCVLEHKRPDDWPRRCKSVPPPRDVIPYKNPITWQ